MIVPLPNTILVEKSVPVTIIEESYQPISTYVSTPYDKPKHNNKITLVSQIQDKNFILSDNYIFIASNVCDTIANNVNEKFS